MMVTSIGGCTLVLGVLVKGDLTLFVIHFYKAKVFMLLLKFKAIF